MSTGPEIVEEDAAVVAPEAAEAPETPEVTPEQADPTPQVDPAIEEEARALGWKPESEWNGPKPRFGFMTPEEYLETPKAQTVRLQNRLDSAERAREAAERDFSQRLERMNAMHAEAERRRADNHKRELERLRADQRKAVEEMDLERYDALTAEVDNLGPAPVVEDPKPVEDAPVALPGEVEAVTAWRQNPQNAWFHANPYMQQAAMDAYTEAANIGKNTPAERLAYMEQRIGTMFNMPKPAESPKPRPPAVDPGGLAGRKVSLVSKLPAEARAAMAALVKDGTFKSEEDYAKVYFEEYPDG